MEEQEQHVMFIRLKSGDDLISEVVELEIDDDLMFMLINPLKVMYIESEHSGYLTVAFMPWVFPSICDTQEFTINSDDVLTITDVSKKMNDYYWNNLDALKEKAAPLEKKPEPEQNESMLDILQALAKQRTYH